jgi:hypothetical protein
VIPNVTEEIQAATLVEQAEQYEDMVSAMKNMVMLKKAELTYEERKSFSLAYKNVIDCRRSAWRTASQISQKTIANAATKQQLQKTEKEIRDICHEALMLLDKFLIPKASTVESKVFFGKMKGDCYRYLTEVATGDEQLKLNKESQQFYNEAYNIAKKSLQPTNSIRLDLALNFSTFYYEILNASDRACRLAKEAFDDAIAQLDTLEEDMYKESLLIMQLLRDSLVQWTRDAPNAD